jgi:hypothetical protein
MANSLFAGFSYADFLPAVHPRFEWLVRDAPINPIKARAIANAGEAHDLFGRATSTDVCTQAFGSTRISSTCSPSDTLCCKLTLHLLSDDLLYILADKV